MKMKAFILSVYILSLNFIICEDFHESDDLTQIETVQKLGNEHGHLDTDLCSPFCVCQCCQMNIVTSEIQAYKLDSEELFSSIFYANKGVEQDFLNTILHPPQA